MNQVVCLVLQITESSYLHFFFKLIEYILLPVLKNFTRVSPYHFGYREKASTILASALLEETINAYTAANNSVYSCFIDLSKAIERINPLLPIAHKSARIGKISIQN